MSLTYSQYQQQFLDYCLYQKRYSQHTITAYKNDISSFGIYLQNEFDETAIDAVKTTYVRSWLASLKENKITSKSINRKISSLRSFFTYLLKQDAVKTNPVSVVTSPKTPKRLPVFLDEDATNNLLHHTSFTEGFVGLTEKLIFEILYHTGIRKGELIQLKERQVDFSNATLKVFGKGNKERLVPITATLINDIKFYVSEKQKCIGKRDDDVLLVTLKGKPLDPKQVYNIAKKYLSTVTTIAQKSPHVLRHSFATQLMNNGADLNAVKELLGHNSLAATQIYTHNSIDKLKDVYKKAHPKA